MTEPTRSSRAAVIVILATVGGAIVLGLALIAILGRSSVAPSKQTKSQEPLYRGLPLSHYLDLLKDRDDQTQLEAMKAVSEMPSFDEDVLARVRELAWDPYANPYSRILALNYIAIADRWEEDPSRVSRALKVCESIEAEDIPFTSDDWRLYALPCRRWSEKGGQDTSTEPTFDGHPLSYWVRHLDATASARREQAVKAIQAVHARDKEVLDRLRRIAWDPHASERLRIMALDHLEIYDDWMDDPEKLDAALDCCRNIAADLLTTSDDQYYLTKPCARWAKLNDRTPS